MPRNWPIPKVAAIASAQRTRPAVELIPSLAPRTPARNQLRRLATYASRLFAFLLVFARGAGGQRHLMEQPTLAT